MCGKIRIMLNLSLQPFSGVCNSVALLLSQCLQCHFCIKIVNYICGPMIWFLFSLSHWKSDKSIHNTYTIKMINNVYTYNMIPFDCLPLLGKKFQTEAQGESISTVVFSVAQGQVFLLCVFSLSVIMRVLFMGPILFTQCNKRYALFPLFWQCFYYCLFRYRKLVPTGSGCRASLPLWGCV